MTNISRRLVFAWCAVAFFHGAPASWAQFTDAHNYDNTPVGVNQVEFSFAFVRANASIDPSLIIANAKLDLNQGSIDYTRYFSLFRRLAWVEAAVPVATLGGSITGTNIDRSTSGVGDSSGSFAMLLKGGPALSVSQFDNYTPTTIVGVSLTMTAPTGGYDPNRILNLGSDRWSFKPEIALSQPFGPEGKWQLDLYANAYFYTDNTTYRGKEILRQEPLAGLEGHISRSLSDRVWLSFDTRYSFRGATLVDGVGQDNAQENVVLGSEVSVSLNSRNSVLIEVAKATVHQNGPSIAGFSVKYDYTWGRGYR
jgi:hypothetical protein